MSPAHDETLSGLRVTMQIAGASGQFVDAGQSLAYAFELQTASGAHVRSETVSGTTWAYPDELQNDTTYVWRARAVVGDVAGPWSDSRAFRTRTLPGCVNGRLVDPKAYFFHLIGRTEGSPARDWYSVLQRSGLPAGPVRGERLRHNAPFYGLTQQIDSSGTLRGRVFLPTDVPDSFGYFIHHVDVLSDAGASRWVWQPLGGPAYVPQACP